MMDVQKQAGGSNCGLFAIAFATTLINGKQPGSIVVLNVCWLCMHAWVSRSTVIVYSIHIGNNLFKQEEMRRHLIECLE